MNRGTGVLERGYGIPGPFPPLPNLFPNPSRSERIPAPISSSSCRKHRPRWSPLRWNKRQKNPKCGCRMQLTAPCPFPSRNVSVRFKSTSSGTLNGETVISCSGCLLSRWTGSPAASSITPPLPECSAMSGIMPQGHCRDLAAEGDRNNEDERPCLGSSWHARRDGGTFSYRPLDPLFMCMPLPGDKSRSFRADADGLHEKYARKR